MTAWKHISQLLASSKYLLQKCFFTDQTILTPRCRRHAPRTNAHTLIWTRTRNSPVTWQAERAGTSRRGNRVSQQPAGPAESWQDGRHIVYTAYFKKCHKLTNSNELAASQMLPVTVQNEHHSTWGHKRRSLNEISYIMKLIYNKTCNVRVTKHWGAFLQPLVK